VIGTLTKRQIDEVIERGDAAMVAIDGGLGMAAVAAVAALRRGPQRDLEIENWIRRFESFGGMIALPLTPITTDDEFHAVVDLQLAMAGLA